MDAIQVEVISQWWEGIPNWAMAATSLLTLGAAIFAGVFAGKAAHWTKKQAEASDNQVRIAGEALVVAQQEARSAQASAELQREEADRAYRRFAESRLDALAPVILAVAKPGTEESPHGLGWLEVRRYDGGSWSEWRPVQERFEETEVVDVVFRTRVTVTLTNVSEQVARVDIIDSAHGETDVRPGTPIIVPPREHRTIIWTRNLSPGMLATHEEIHQPKNCLFELTLWVRDLGMNVRDTYKFNGDLRLFSRDGSRLIVQPEPEPQLRWDENVATPLQDRTYGRLDAQAADTSALHGRGRDPSTDPGPCCYQSAQDALKTVQLTRRTSEPSFVPAHRNKENRLARVHEDNMSWFAGAVKRSGVPRITPHDLRHPAASFAVSAGANVKAVQKMLGHASAAMTLDVYADLFDGDLDSVSDALDHAVSLASVGNLWANL